MIEYIPDYYENIWLLPEAFGIEPSDPYSKIYDHLDGALTILSTIPKYKPARHMGPTPPTAEQINHEIDMAENRTRLLREKYNCVEQILKNHADDKPNQIQYARYLLQHHFLHLMLHHPQDLLESSGNERKPQYKQIFTPSQVALFFPNFNRLIHLPNWDNFTFTYNKKKPALEEIQGDLVFSNLYASLIESSSTSETDRNLQIVLLYTPNDSQIFTTRAKALLHWLATPGV